MAKLPEFDLRQVTLIGVMVLLMASFGWGQR